MAEQWTYDGPEWIYLQPVDDAPPKGREWSSDAINLPTEEREDQTEPTDCPYVRGDIHDAVVEKLAERDREVGGLVKAFSHYHEAKYDIKSKLTDQCKRCGLDIRNVVHIRTSVIPEETPHAQE